MEVSPVEGVHGEQRRHDAERLQLVQLIHADGLAVDHDRATVLGAVAVRGVAHRPDQQVDGGVAVGVDLDLPVVPEGQFDGVQGLLLGHRRIAAIGGGLALGRYVVGLGQPGGLALGRAVQRQLDPADAELADVVLAIERRGHDVGRGQDVGEGQDVDRQLAALGHLGHQLT